MIKASLAQHRGRKLIAAPAVTNSHARSTPAKAEHSHLNNPWSVDVVITSHNYGRYLQECIDSIKSQDGLGKIILVDDSSTDETPNFASQVDCYVKVTCRHPSLSRRAGLNKSTAPLACWMDADNRLNPGFLAEAIGRFQKNSKLAICYSHMSCFEELNGLFFASDPYDPQRMEVDNYMDTCAVFRVEAMRQTGALDCRVESHEDWFMWRRIMDSGYWQAECLSIPFNYRVHAGSMVESYRKKPYYVQRCFDYETITLFTTYSQRIADHPELWQRRLDWINTQIWPKDRLRLVVANTCGEANPKLPNDLAGVSIYNHVVTPGLETEYRDQRRTESIQTTVGAIYNRAFREINSRLILIIEDDIFPHANDLIYRMLRSFDAETCGVSATYRLRTHPHVFCHWYGKQSGYPEQSTEVGEGIEQIGGNGFGCVLLRKDLLLQPFFGNSEVSIFYDVDFWNRVFGKYKLKLDWSLRCDHVDGEGQTVC